MYGQDRSAIGLLELVAWLVVRGKLYDCHTVVPQMIRAKSAEEELFKIDFPQA